MGPVYNSRRPGSPVTSSGWKGTAAHSADSSLRRSVNGRPDSAGGSALSSNPYDLLFEQGEVVEIDDGEV
jgi:hypothetical protein